MLPHLLSALPFATVIGLIGYFGIARNAKKNRIFGSVTGAIVAAIVYAAISYFRSAD